MTGPRNTHFLPALVSGRQHIYLWRRARRCNDDVTQRLSLLRLRHEIAAKRIRLGHSCGEAHAVQPRRETRKPRKAQCQQIAAL